MNRLAIFSAIALGLAAATTANAAVTLDVREGQLFGASGVSINGALFDVSFVDGTCIALFDGCDEETDFTFGARPIDGLAAGQALLDQVFLDGPSGLFDTNPGLTFGVGGDLVNFQIPIGPLTYGRFYGPFGIAGFISVTNNPSEGGDYVFDNSGSGSGLGRGFDTSLSDGVVFARFSANDIAPVPLPAGLPLLVAGLGAFGLVRRRRS